MKLKRFRIPSPRIRLPIPGGVYLGGGKLILLSLSTVGVGFLAAMFLAISSGGSEIVWPDPGTYDAPSRLGATAAEPERSQTLQLNLPAGSRIRDIIFTNVSIGKGGLTEAFQIKHSTTTDSGYLVVDDFIVRGSSFPTADFANSEFFLVNATSSVEVAGHTVSATYSTSTADITVGSSRGIGDYIVDGGSVDRIIIEISGSGDVIVDRVILDGVRASDGALDVDWVKAGTLTLESLRVGDDGDINSADFIINSSVLYTTFNDAILDVAVFVR